MAIGIGDLKSFGKPSWKVAALVSFCTIRGKIPNEKQTEQLIRSADAFCRRNPTVAIINNWSD